MIAQLDTKTVYSFLESVVSIEGYVTKAKEYGYSSLAIMDVDNLYGAYQFLEVTKAQGLQGLLGMEVTLLHEERAINLRFLARSTKGYQELLKLSNLKMTGKKDWTDFSQHVTDIVVIVPYFEGIADLDLGLPVSDFYPNL